MAGSLVSGLSSWAGIGQVNTGAQAKSTFNQWKYHLEQRLKESFPKLKKEESQLRKKEKHCGGEREGCGVKNDKNAVRGPPEGE